MRPKKSVMVSCVAAGLLAVLTLFVFFTFQNYGPVSAVRRFHDDVRNKDITDLQRVTVGSLENPQVGELAKALLTFDSLNATSKIAAVQMLQSDEAAVITVYEMQDNRVLHLVWIVRKEPNQPWRIDPALTLKAIMSLRNREAS